MVRQLIKKLHRLSSEQLSRIENDMETMNAEMKEAEKHLTGMEKWCGLCVCPWNRFEACLAFVEHFLESLKACLESFYHFADIVASTM